MDDEEIKLTEDHLIKAGFTLGFTQVPMSHVSYVHKSSNNPSLYLEVTLSLGTYGFEIQQALDTQGVVIPAPETVADFKCLCRVLKIDIKNPTPKFYVELRPRLFCMENGLSNMDGMAKKYDTVGEAEARIDEHRKLTGYDYPDAKIHSTK